MSPSHLFVTVSAGPSADQAIPIMGISDPRIVDAVFRAIARLNPRSTSASARLLHARRSQAPATVSEEGSNGQ
jgi:hypothetical protein